MLRARNQNLENPPSGCTMAFESFREAIMLRSLVVAVTAPCLHPALPRCQAAEALERMIDGAG